MQILRMNINTGAPGSNPAEKLHRMAYLPLTCSMAAKNSMYPCVRCVDTPQGEQRRGVRERPWASPLTRVSCGSAAHCSRNAWHIRARVRWGGYLNELVGGLQIGVRVSLSGHVAIRVHQPVAHLEVVLLLRIVQRRVIDVIARHHGVAHLR